MKNLKDIRKEKGYTQKQIADFLGVSIRTVQNWEQGRSKTPQYVLKLLPILELQE